MATDIFKGKKPVGIDKSLDTLQKIKERKEKIINEESQTINNIRNGFENVVVMFIDLVDSTKFKLDNHDKSEKWILRVKQFSDIVSEYVNECGGRVVKYIGDEVMVVFNRKSMVNDSINLLNRIKELQNDLTEITEVDTKVKVALDIGNVYFLKYTGHNEPDPQGTPVDRCARIAKYCKPSIILSSYDYVSQGSHTKMWHKVGDINLKGIGLTSIFQYNEATIDILPITEISEIELQNLKNKISEQKIELENKNLQYKEALSINIELNNKLVNLGKQTDIRLIENDVAENKNECEKLWDSVMSKIEDLKKIIQKSNVSIYEYARFLFLSRRDESWEFNAFEGAQFNSVIEANLVKDEDENGYYSLDYNNRRNKKAIQLMDEIEHDLSNYNDKCRNSDNNEEDDDLFEYSLNDAEFWNDYIGYNVKK